MTPPLLDVDLDEIRTEVICLMVQSSKNDGLPRSEVVWLCNTIADLIWQLKHERKGKP